MESERDKQQVREPHRTFKHVKMAAEEGGLVAAMTQGRHTQEVKRYVQ